MAFFGLTHLGEQNYFMANSASHGINLTLFGPQDMKVAFKQAAGKKMKTLPAERVGVFLEKLYAGPMKNPQDEEMMIEALGKPEPGTEISEDECIAACMEVSLIFWWPEHMFVECQYTYVFCTQTIIDDAL